MILSQIQDAVEFCFLSLYKTVSFSEASSEHHGTGAGSFNREAAQHLFLKRADRVPYMFYEQKQLE